MTETKPTPTYFEACQVARDFACSLPAMPDIASLYRAAMVMGMEIHALAPEWADRVLREWRAIPPSTDVVLKSALIHSTIDRARSVRRLYDAERAALPPDVGLIKLPDQDASDG